MVTSAIGTYFADRDQPSLSAEERQTVAKFHDLYYRRWRAGADTINLSWFGYRVFKCPLDLWIYQEILARTRPDVVVETGTKFGGSALYLAMMLDRMGHGQIITIDNEAIPDRPEHPRITYITGSSIDPAIVLDVKQRVGGDRAMVLLDSDHRAAHVLAEIIAYCPLVQVGDYLVIEDTNLNGHPVRPEFGPGPMEAVEMFLSKSDEFTPDGCCERFLMTLNPGGYLRRHRPDKGSKSVGTALR